MIAVVSIGLGTVNAVAHIAENQNFIDKYEAVVTTFDNDQATDEQKRNGIVKGRDATSSVHLFLGGHGYYAELNTNDLNDYLKEGRGKDLYWTLMKPRKWQHSKVLEGCSVTLEEINTPIPQGFTIDFLPRFMDMLGTFRPYELSILLAPPKTGKSLLAKHIFWQARRQGVKTCGAFLEDDTKKLTQSIIALDAGVPIPKFRKDPTLVSDEKKLEVMNTLFNEDYLQITSEKGHISPEEVVRLVEYAAQRGTQFVVFDHLSYVLSGHNTGNERKDIDKLLTDLEAIKKRYPIHILAIAHITVEKNRGIKKDKEGDIIYPYWYEVNEYDGRGSSAFTQLCDNMFAIDKQYLEDGSRGYTRARILLNREEDNTGVCDQLTLDHITGRLQEVAAY